MGATPSRVEAGITPREGFAADVKENNFDIIRLILAILVIYSHSYPGLGKAHDEPLTVLSGGQGTLGGMAVSCFFMISGFLITRSWDGSPGLRSYLSKRVRRIYPGFIVASLVCLFVVGPMGASNSSDYWRDFDPTRFAVGLLLLDPDFPPTFHGLSVSEVNGALWTIRWEFLCYLYIPVIASLGCIRRRPWLLALFSATMALLFVKVQFAPGIRFPGTLIAPFMAGQLYYLYRDIIKFKKFYFICACTMLLFSAIAAPLKLMLIFMPIFGSYILFYIAFFKSKLLKFLKSLMMGNDLSYGVYLYGWPAEGLIIQAFGQHLVPPVLFVWTTLASLMLGAMSWFLVERYFLAHRLERGCRAAQVARPAEDGHSATKVALGEPCR